MSPGDSSRLRWIVKVMRLSRTRRHRFANSSTKRRLRRIGSTIQHSPQVFACFTGIHR